LNAKIEVMIALAPAASVANVKSLVRLSAAFVNPIEVFLFVILKQNNTMYNELFLKIAVLFATDKDACIYA